MRDCPHEWLDMGNPWNERLQKIGSVRFFFYCKKCLAIQYRDVPDTFWHWTEPEPWRGDELPTPS